MPFLENLAEGLGEAAGNEGVVNRIEKQKADRQATSQEELHARTQMILNDVQGVQQKIAALDPNAPDYQQKVAQHKKELTDLQQIFTDLYHPVKNPGALQQLGGILNKIRGKQTPAAPSGPSMTERMAQANVAGAGTSQTAPAVNPYVVKAKQLKEAGFSDDQIKKIQEIDTGLQAKATAPKSKTVISVEPDPESPTGYSKVVTDQQTGEEISRQTNVLPPRGFIASESTTTDPFGVTSTTKRTPILPGQKKAEGTTPEKKTPGQMKKDLEGKVSKTGQPQHLDVEGHIPPTAKINQQLREAANQLLDGKGIKDLQVPQRDKAAAADLARKFGWAGEGMFTPKDRLLLRESTGILKQISQSDSLSVLDDTASRLKLSQVLQNPEKRGMVGQTIQTMTAANLSPAEQQFVTLYNQAVGRISGLSQLVRSGRATEAQIERLKSELPNPATTSSSDHARQKLAQIQNEIDIALDKGQFVETPTPSGKGSDMTDDEFLLNLPKR